ncbi:hypothetical protein R1flu_010488 [Riccia fluitans]|uniref:Uncharacterized protein n=1 Tax=Riccia fluitans TaxID=41844 RepID=A0ABD1Z5G5_9MARC
MLACHVAWSRLPRHKPCHRQWWAPLEEACSIPPLSPVPARVQATVAVRRGSFRYPSRIADHEGCAEGKLELRRGYSPLPVGHVPSPPKWASGTSGLTDPWTGRQTDRPLYAPSPMRIPSPWIAIRSVDQM